jgi:hypothetical protein
MKLEMGISAGEKKVDRVCAVNGNQKENLYLSLDIDHAMGFIL